MTRTGIQWWVPATTIGILCATWLWQATLPDASVGAPFLAKVKEAVKDYPAVVGDWIGEDSTLPQEAVALLHPNVYISRRYHNMQTKEDASMLLIEAEDSRDMMGHYPPNCYPGNGWELQRASGATWQVDHLTIPGTEYEFRKVYRAQESKLWVRSFFILPNGKFFPEIASFGRAAADFYIRPYGATQVQVIYDREYLPEDRDRIFTSLMSAHKGLIDILRWKDR